MLRGDASRTTVGIGLGLAAAVGAVCAWLVAAGNPGNMGICGACFLRDLAGALGFIRGEGPRIFRPEIVGVMGGALLWVTVRGKYAARSGGYAVARFFFGVWMAIGALVFLGCPFRMLQRIGGGDGNALVGALGFVAGVGLGLVFERRGYSPGKTAAGKTSAGRTQGVPAPVGLVGPATAALLLGLFLAGSLLLGPGPGEAGGPPHAAWWVSLGLSLAAGVALSATGFCAVSAARQVFQRRRRMLLAAGLLVVGYAAVALATGGFKAGFEGQPIAHTDALWNVLSLALVGLTGVLAGGCPVRQMVMAGEGNGDAFVAVAGLVVGGGLAHNLGLVSGADGPTEAGMWAVGIGFVLAITYALAMTTGKRSSP